MAAGPWTFTNASRTSLLDGSFDLDSDTFKIALYTSSWSAAAATTYTTTNEVATAYGYTRGGITINQLALSGTTTVKVDNSVSIVWTASGGSIVARYAAIYENSGKFLCYCLLDSSPADVSTTTGNTLTITMNDAGIFTLA